MGGSVLYKNCWVLKHPEIKPHHYILILVFSDIVYLEFVGQWGIGDNDNYFEFVYKGYLGSSLQTTAWI